MQRLVMSELLQHSSVALDSRRMRVVFEFMFVDLDCLVSQFVSKRALADAVVAAYPHFHGVVVGSFTLAAHVVRRSTSLLFAFHLARTQSQSLLQVGYVLHLPAMEINLALVSVCLTTVAAVCFPLLWLLHVAKVEAAYIRGPSAGHVAADPHSYYVCNVKAVSSNVLATD